MRGRKPSPPRLRLVTGTAGRGIKPPDPPVTGELRNPPKWLTPAQVVLWNDVIRNAAPGHLRLTDTAILTVYIIAIDLGRQAQALIGDDLTIESPSGVLKPHPAIAIVNAQAAIALRAAVELGFTPASRSRITIAPEQVQADEFFP